MTAKVASLSLAALLAAACVTINVYFPEAEAQRAADRIIEEVRGGAASQPPGEDDGNTTGHLAAPPPVMPPVSATLLAVLDALVPPAHAQSRADFDVSSPATRTLRQSLKERFERLKPYYDSGAIGLTADGTIDFRDRGLIPLAERNRVRQLVAEQNADWESLYREIARINGHPEWEDEIRDTFAERWIAKAQPGWYYRDESGNWRQQ